MNIDYKELQKKIFGKEMLILVGTLVLFLITNSLIGEGSSWKFLPPLLGVAIFAEIFIFVGLEVKQGASKNGWQHEIIDTIVAFCVAIAVWYSMQYLLHTNSPISAVVSCSMLPNLQRWDFVIVQGAAINAYEIQMTRKELDSLSGPSTIQYGENSEKNQTIIGSIYSYCIDKKTKGINEEVCDQFIKNPQNIRETKGALTYTYESCTVERPTGNGVEPCVKSIIFHGQGYLTNFSNDIIVYQPPKGDLYSYVGDIVHRAYFKINVTDSDSADDTYYLTRGDNNPILDLQVYSYDNALGNTPIPASQSRGKVLLRVPYLGYFKLFLSGFFSEDPQCKLQRKFDHV